MLAEAQSAGWSGQVNLNSILLILLIAGNAKTLWDKTGGNLITKPQFEALRDQVNRLEKLSQRWSDYLELMVEAFSDSSRTPYDGIRHYVKTHPHPKDE